MKYQATLLFVLGCSTSVDVTRTSDDARPDGGNVSTEDGALGQRL